MDALKQLSRLDEMSDSARLFALECQLSTLIQKYSDVFRCRVPEPTKKLLVFISPVLQRGAPISDTIFLVWARRAHRLMGTAGPDEGKNITTKAPALKHGAN